MAGNEYDQGELLRATGTFKTSADALLDPSVVLFEFRKPGAAVVLYTYPTDTQLVKDSTGVYHVDLSLDTAGAWVYRWYSTGTGQAAEPGEFTVKADPVV